MAFTFRGGAVLAELKHTKHVQTVTMPAPDAVTLPLAGREPCVAAGDRVDMGQIVAGADASLPLPATVSGTVREVTETAVVIDSDGEDRMAADLVQFPKKLADAEKDELTAVLRRCAVVNNGRPLADDVTAAAEKPKRLILDCAESEPMVTAASRLLLERPADVLNGLKILLKALGLRCADVAVSENLADVHDKLGRLIGGSPLFRLSWVRVRAPQSESRMLIEALTSVELSARKDPAACGYLVVRPAAAAAVYRAFADGRPMIEVPLTVDGDCVKTPGNVLVRVGTPAADVVAFCGGLKKEPAALLSGGPLTGKPLAAASEPVTADMTALLALSKAASAPVKHPACIRCGRCVAACPMRLVPCDIAEALRRGRVAAAGKRYLADCIECGVCAAVCPAGMPLTALFRDGKRKLAELTGTSATENVATEDPVGSETAAADEETADTADVGTAGSDIPVADDVENAAGDAAAASEVSADTTVSDGGPADESEADDASVEESADTPETDDASVEESADTPEADDASVEESADTPEADDGPAPETNDTEDTEDADDTSADDADDAGRDDDADGPENASGDPGDGEADDRSAEIRKSRGERKEMRKQKRDRRKNG